MYVSSDKALARRKWCTEVGGRTKGCALTHSECTQPRLKPRICAQGFRAGRWEVVECSQCASDPLGRRIHDESALFRAHRTSARRALPLCIFKLWIARSAQVRLFVGRRAGFMTATLMCWTVHASTCYLNRRTSPQRCRILDQIRLVCLRLDVRVEIKTLANSLSY